MSKIITDIESLKTPVKPLEFLTDKGVEKEEGLSIIAQLKEELNADEHLLALSAPQIGINARIFCIKFNDVIKTFINPIITKKSGSIIAPETCASMPGKEIVINRPEEVTVVYYTDEFKYEDNKLLGPAARIFDQQAQLLDGVTPDELGLVSDVKEDGSLYDATDEEMQEIIAYYKDTYIPTLSKKYKEAIESHPELAQRYNNLKATEEVINGRITVVEDTPKLNRATRRALAKRQKRAGGKK